MAVVVIWGFAIALTSTAAFTDARTGRIPNWLNAAGLVAALSLHGLNGWAGLRLAIVGLLVSGFVPTLLHLLTQGRALGGGDVKLFAVLGALLGPFSGLEVQLLSYSVLLGFALCTLAFNGRLLAMLRNAAALLLGRIFLKLRLTSDPELLTTMRLGPAIFAAVLLLALHAHWPWLLS
jgi:prepilin peptidase CpaA